MDIDLIVLLICLGIVAIGIFLFWIIVLKIGDDDEE